jgi:FSR family fosmidomycin resistance protein-like MFS transporter
VFVSKGDLGKSLDLWGCAWCRGRDLCCGFFTLLNRHIITASGLFGWAIFYNAVAFGLRAPFGLVVDYFRIPRPAAALGCVLVAGSTITYSAMPLYSVIVVGIGNALFHVGGGGISFNLVPKRATPPGIFAAPGALGIGVGTVIGKTGHFIAWPFISLLLASSLLMYAVQMPEMDYDRQKSKDTMR